VRNERAIRHTDSDLVGLTARQPGIEQRGIEQRGIWQPRF
jgi:hypothetical protein